MGIHIGVQKIQNENIYTMRQVRIIWLEDVFYQNNRVGLFNLLLNVLKILPCQGSLAIPQMHRKWTKANMGRTVKHVVIIYHWPFNTHDENSDLVEFHLNFCPFTEVPILGDFNLLMIPWRLKEHVFLLHLLLAIYGLFYFNRSCRFWPQHLYTLAISWTLSWLPKSDSVGNT